MRRSLTYKHKVLADWLIVLRLFLCLCLCQHILTGHNNDIGISISISIRRTQGFDILSHKWRWLRIWLPLRLSKRQSPTTVLFRIVTTLTRTITLVAVLTSAYASYAHAFASASASACVASEDRAKRGIFSCAFKFSVLQIHVVSSAARKYYSTRLDLK